MDDVTEDGASPPKRTDVGYKRPPKETQFKKGQKPPPRKKKTITEPSAKDILWKLLQERRRVIVDAKAAWLTNAELIARRGYLEAEKGSPVLQRLINQLILQSEQPSGEEIPEVVILPEEECGGMAAGTIIIREGPPQGT